MILYMGQPYKKLIFGRTFSISDLYKIINTTSEQTFTNDKQNLELFGPWKAPLN